MSNDVLNALRRSYKEALFDSAIRKNVKLQEAPSHGKDIFDYAPESIGAQDYKALCTEFLRRFENGAR